MASELMYMGQLGSKFKYFQFYLLEVQITSKLSTVDHSDQSNTYIFQKVKINPL